MTYVTPIIPIAVDVTADMIPAAVMIAAAAIPVAVVTHGALETAATAVL